MFGPDLCGTNVSNKIRFSLSDLQRFISPRYVGKWLKATCNPIFPLYTRLSNSHCAFGNKNVHLTFNIHIHDIISTINGVNNPASILCGNVHWLRDCLNVIGAKSTCEQRTQCGEIESSAWRFRNSDERMPNHIFQWWSYFIVKCTEWPLAIAPTLNGVHWTDEHPSRM